MHIVLSNAHGYPNSLVSNACYYEEQTFTRVINPRSLPLPLIVGVLDFL
jgi:hypothetical protein